MKIRDRVRSQGVIADERIYSFNCRYPGCRGEGELRLNADEIGEFVCPGCGTIYVESKDLRGWALKVVVVPPLPYRL